MLRAVMSLLTVALLSVGCTTQGKPFIQADGNLQHGIAEASDWVFRAGSKTYQDVGQVTVSAGYDWKPCYAYAGVSHLSLARYGHDIGLNSVMAGVGCRYYFH
ncbi:hypothetical protein [Thiothrix fructosivorans]|uniref:Lipoprotein n=1 Tax=Thiothrix fructosivorans TaxID=111770 RepID=A0A8B0SNZ6_9GAMM|nr:hypothetical protein [Thiothrix fructosivorans]MBO0611718.1 hypothetical protein [Thiothrix fructosivorans]QTX10622.1 hypothetical protein J1836_018990 [Thiothrix fructosivorans]